MGDLSPGWWLAVDFGTSNTAAAHTDQATGEVQTLPLAHTGNTMPSSVFIESVSHIEVGDAARNRAADRPERFLAAPKRLLAAGNLTVPVADADLPMHLIVAAILRTVLARAVRHHDGARPSALVLTHPEGWAQQQRAVMVAAAGDVGFPPDRVTLVSEPQAAAHYYAGAGRVDPDSRVAVFDFGGGTLDVAILGATPDGGYTVVAARGDTALGGHNIDAAITRWLEHELAQRNPGLLDGLRNAHDLDRLAVAESVRSAKELLSEAATAGIDVRVEGRGHERFLLTRPEFDLAVDGEVRRALELARTTLAMAAAVDPRPLQAIYLTGGSTKIPLVHERLRGLGPVSTLDDPKTVVVKGAIAAARSTPQPPGQTSTSVLPPRTPPTTDPGPAPRRKRGRRRVAVVAVAAVIVAAAAVVVVLNWPKPKPATTTNPPAVKPATVILHVTRPTGTSICTGTVLTADGEVAAFDGDLIGATGISAVDQGNNQSYPATVLGYDRTVGIALLRLTGAHDLAAATAATTTPTVGTWVTVLGDNGDTGIGSFAGHITQVNQSLTLQPLGVTLAMTGLIESDAPVQDGSSGGPWVDGNGEVLGLSFARSNDMQYSYAMPMTAITPVVRQIEQGTASDEVHIGPPAQLDLSISNQPDGGGARVGTIYPDSPLSGSGLAVNDVITAIDGTPVHTGADLTGYLQNREAGQPVGVDWTDSAGNRHSVTVDLVAGVGG